MSLCAPPEHARGDTFDYSGQLTLVYEGDPMPDLTGWTGASEIRTAYGKPVDILEFIWINPAQGIIRVRKQDTSNWPIGPAEWVVRLTNADGDTISTRPAAFTITRG